MIFGQLVVQVMNWDGRRWSESTRFGQGRLVAVAALRSNDVWAVGYDSNIRRHQAYYSKTLVTHWDGTRWSRVPSPTPDDTRCTGCQAEQSDLYGIIPVSANEVWALGSQFTF